MSKVWGHGFYAAAEKQVPAGVHGAVKGWLMLQGANAKDWFEGAVRSAVIEWLDTGKGDDLMNPMTNAELQMAINETFKLIERSDKIQGGENIIDALDKHLLSLLTTQHNRAILITVSLDESPV